MTNIRLVILGILGRRPMYGYEIKHIIEDHMGDWTDIKFGSIYFALSKMAEERLVEIIEETHEGNRPSRIVYRITQQGQNEFYRLLRELWSNDDSTLYSFDIGVFFMNNLTRSEVDEFLGQRITRLQQKIAYLEQHQFDQMKNPHIPPQAAAIMQHSQLHLNAELIWTQGMKENLNNYF